LTKKDHNGIGNVKPVLYIDGRDLPTLLLRKVMRPTAGQPHARRRLRQRGSYLYGSARGEAKRHRRADHQQAVMAQQAIEAAFRSKQMNWHDVERELRKSMLHWQDIALLCQLHGVDVTANDNFKLKQAA
jgi:hypothetical protein